MAHRPIKSWGAADRNISETHNEIFMMIPRNMLAREGKRANSPQKFRENRNNEISANQKGSGKRAGRPTSTPHQSIRYLKGISGSVNFFTKCVMLTYFHF